MGILAVYDTIGIQNYIYNSRKLKENKGASALVGDIFSDMLPSVLKDTNNNCITNWDECLNLPLDDTIPAEIIYIGGGNAYLAFRDSSSESADDFFNRFNESFLKCVFDRTGGVGIAIAGVNTDFKNGFTSDFDKLHKRLSAVKGGLNHTIAAGNQPITLTSALTGLPATFINGKELLSKDQELKRDAAPNTGIVEFEQLEIDDSMLAVMHVDGNSMGEQIKRYCENLDDYSEAVPKVRNMAYRITRYFGVAYDNIKNKFGSYYEEHYKDNNNDDLPLINIVEDGDDITCVIAGRFGISFAVELLREIEKLYKEEAVYPFPLEKNKVKIYACAGVVLFHSHYPFYAAYEMAEQCCSNAKRYAREQPGSYIDFHLHQSGAVTSLNSFRQRLYSVDNYSLLCRPWCISRGEKYSKYPSFDIFEKFQSEWIRGEETSRSRTKELRNAFGKDENETDKVIKWYESRGDKIPDTSQVPRIIGKDRSIELYKHAPLFDVLEFADFYENIAEVE